MGCYIKEHYKLSPNVENYGQYIDGPFTLDIDTVNSKVEKDKIGNYILGDKDLYGLLEPAYVGKADIRDLHTRLCEHANPKDEYNQPYFMFLYVNNRKDACDLKCIMYHEFKDKFKLLNKRHPGLPPGIECPLFSCEHVGCE